MELNDFEIKPFFKNEKEFNLLTNTDFSLCLLGLKEKEFITVLGYSNLSIIKGGIELMGYELSSIEGKLSKFEKLPKIDIFSSRSTSLLSLKSKRIYRKPSIKQFPSELILTNEIREFIQKFEENNELHSKFETIILFQINNNGIGKLQQLDNRFKSLFELVNDEKGDKLVSSLYLLNYNNINFQNFYFSKNWTFILEEFSKFSKTYENYQINRKPILKIVGGKNTGKSSFSKFAINKLLNTHDKVAFLNCDPGQTELVPAGFISLHIIESPLLGPNFSQLQQPVGGFYLGDHNVKTNPEYFIKGCEALIKQYYNLNELTQSGDNQRIPLVVNTYGWVKRLGMDVLIQLTELLKPSHLVQFHSTMVQSYQLGLPLPIDPIQQFPYSLDPFPENIKSDLIQHMDALNENPRTCRLFLIPTISELIDPASSNKFTHQKYQPIDHRDLLLYSYFHKSFDQREWSSTPLTSCETYSFPINQIELWNLQEDCVDLSQVLYAFNLSLIALYTFKGDLELDNNNNNPKIPNYVNPSIAVYPPPEHYNCIGFGIIKSIDTTKNQFNILSPLPASELSKVRAFVKGELTLPTNILIENGTNNIEKLPYFSLKRTLGYGASSKKARTNLKRVGIQSPISK